MKRMVVGIVMEWMWIQGKGAFYKKWGCPKSARLRSKKSATKGFYEKK